VVLCPRGSLCDAWPYLFPHRYALKLQQVGQGRAGEPVTIVADSGVDGTLVPT
jgi:hypothetical protein